MRTTSLVGWVSDQLVQLRYLFVRVDQVHVSNPVLSEQLGLSLFHVISLVRIAVPVKLK